MSRCLLLLVGLWSSAAVAQEAWLVTYGPGEEVWERFGHNAIWLRDPEAGLDHTFSFGYFELDRPGFHWDFARGIMLYYGAASTREREFDFYRARDRRIETQRLNLSPDQVRELFALLDDAIFPQPQYYAYDYYFANCSTWLRDLLDQVTDGAVSAQLRRDPAGQNFRDHTRRLTAERFWLHTGIMLVLGPTIDRPRTAWEEAFLPAALARALDQVTLAEGEPLVLDRQVIYESSRFHPPDRPAGPWLLSLLLGLAAAVVIVGAARGDGFWSLLPWRLGLMLFGLAGSALALMWIASGHEAAWRNAMLFLLHPLWLLFLLPGSVGFKRVIWWITAGSAALGVIVLALPEWLQFRPDQLLLVVPVVLALLWVQRRQGAEA
ncbi:MAG: DUF4105 domain-containing protein [Wenzhouxiangella sp.]|jgi:hypothetical protein|nr:DUF4105 domain-containing protein [Wenzhouxiangella sp.]